MSARRKVSKNEQLYYCPNKERDWVENGGSKTPWKRDEGCGMSRSLNIPETDKLVWDSVIDVHKKSSILKEEVKWKSRHARSKRVHRQIQEHQNPHHLWCAAGRWRTETGVCLTC